MFQNGELKGLKTEKGCIHPPPSYFDGLPYPGQGGNPIFFMILTAKDVKGPW